MESDDDHDGHYLHEDASYNGERKSGGATAWEALTRVELDSAYISEKLLNLEILLMQVETRASDYEGISLENEDIPAESLEMAFEFDILSGILNSEVTELDSFMAFLQTEIMDGRNRLSPDGQIEESVTELEEKLHDAEEHLKQLHTQVADVKFRTANFESLLAFGAGTDEGAENGDNSSACDRWKLYNVEHQRHILQLYEKSLAKELDLEKKSTDARNSADDLKLKLRCAEVEIFNMEEAMEIIIERMLHAENASEIHLGLFKELSEKLHIELRSKLQEGETSLATQKAESAEFDVHSSDMNGIKPNLEVFALREKVSSLEEQLRESEKKLHQQKASADESQQQKNALHSQLTEMEHVIKNLKENVLQAETRALTAETNCELLTNTNREINEDLNVLRHTNEERTNLLQRKLKESQIQLEHAQVSIEANEEKQNMLNTTRIDMENLIEDLKGKVLKAEGKADAAESKCSLLTETNAELTDELNFIRGRLECLETSLHQADEAKLATEKDIRMRAKAIADLVKKLASERERLQLQISALTKMNRFLVNKYLKRKVKDPFPTSEKGNYSENEHKIFRASGEGLAEPSAIENETDESAAEVFACQKTMHKTVSVADISGESSEHETVRNIGLTQLSLKHLLFGVMITIAAAVAAYLIQSENINS
ncbi:putative WPP domain-interacting tail-anchored protein [Dioscorea sansibarensis]